MSRKAAADKQLALLRAWRRLFLNDDGTQREDARLVLHDLNAALCGNRTTASGTPIDPCRMALNEGKRQALMLIEDRLYGPIETVIAATEEDP